MADRYGWERDFEKEKQENQDREDPERDRPWRGGHRGPASERFADYGDPGDWGRQGSWGTFGNRPDWSRETNWRQEWDFPRSRDPRRQAEPEPYGARGRFAGRGPKNWRRSDERIREDVNERLTEHPDVDATDIEVEVKNGEVTLTGRVDDRASKRIAEYISESVSGVKDVHNQLRIELQTTLIDSRPR
jgi:HSP20 family molecular chaperone IbpA